jgi:membrane protease YdiL (CAAX protease family)
VIAQRQPVGLGRALFAAAVVVILEQTALGPVGDVIDFHKQIGLWPAVIIGAATFLGMLLIARTSFEVAFARRRRQWGAFGIASPRRVVVGVIAFLGLALVALYLGAVLSELTGLTHGTTNITTTSTSTGYAIVVAVLASGVAPWAEELAFRGFAFSALARRMHPLLAAFLASGAWAAFHAVSAVLLPFTLLGMALCWMRWFTRSVLPGIAIHSTYNGLITATSGPHLAWLWSLLVVAATIGTVVATSRWAGRLR